MPVATSTWPVPSSDRRAVMVVSAVVRAISAVRGADMRAA